jgi:hypothetical protein
MSSKQYFWYSPSNLFILTDMKFTYTGTLPGGLQTSGEFEAADRFGADSIFSIRRRKWSNRYMACDGKLNCFSSNSNRCLPLTDQPRAKYLAFDAKYWGN